MRMFVLYQLVGIIVMSDIFCCGWWYIYVRRYLHATSHSPPIAEEIAHHDTLRRAEKVSNPKNRAAEILYTTKALPKNEYTPREVLKGD